MKNNLIVDVGMHKGEDTDFYLRSGFRVISIDADINLVNDAIKKYKDYIDKNMFTVLNYAVTDEDFDEVIFSISEQTLWSSLKPEISNREGKLEKKIKVKTRKLDSIFQEFGVPYYCKIDIEGYDNKALKTLSNSKELPAFISVESECLSEGQVITEEAALQTLDTLFELGYRKFKLVDQSSLSVLELNKKFYNKISVTSRLFNKLKKRWSSRSKYNRQFNYLFPLGSSGPFGNDLEKEWINYEEARKNLKRHRRDYFNTKNAVSYGFWCDWHAKM